MNNTNTQPLSVTLAVWERFVAFLIATVILMAIYGATADLGPDVRRMTFVQAQDYWHREAFAYGFIALIALIIALSPLHEMLYSVARRRARKLREAHEKVRERETRAHFWRRGQNDRSSYFCRLHLEAEKKGWPSCQPPFDHFSGWSEDHGRGHLKEYPCD